MRYSAEQDRTGQGRARGSHGDTAGARSRHETPAPRRPTGRSILITAVFLASTALGAVALPATLNLFMPGTYTATAILGAGKAETIAAMASGVRSPVTLDAVATTLDLAHEPSMAGQAPGALSVATDILAGTEKTASLPGATVRRRLAESLSVMPDPRGGSLALATTTSSAELAVRLANAFANAGVDQAAANAVDEAFGLSRAREAAENAERALADFTASQKAAGGEDASHLSAEIAAHDAAVSAREEALATLKDESAHISALKLADLASGKDASGLDAPLLDAARQKYIAAKLEFDRLSAELGPRHPRLLAAKSTADDARNGLQEALRQLDADYKARVRTASRALDEAKSARAALDAGTEKTENTNPGQLEALQREAERLRADYLDKLDISRAAPLPPASARIVRAASLERVVFNGVSSLYAGLAGAGLGLLLAFGWLAFTRTTARDEDDETDFEAEEMPRRPATLLHWTEEDRRPAPDSDRSLRLAYDADNDDGYADDDDWGPPPAENDDMPLADRLRMLLRRSAEMDFRETMRSDQPGRQDELEEIRRRMDELRDRVAAYNARRPSSRR